MKHVTLRMVIGGIVAGLCGIGPAWCNLPQPLPFLNPINNNPVSPAQPANASEAAIELPSDILPPDYPIFTYLIRKGYFKPLNQNLFYPDAPITRAEFVTLLYRAADLRTPFVSEFPYYRDVPLDYWAYTPIEGFRMRKFAAGTPEGYFEPDKPIRRLDAAVMLSKTLESSWLTLTPLELESTLNAYPDAIHDIPQWAQVDLARSIYSGYLLPITGHSQAPGAPAFALALTAPLSRIDAVRMVYRRALLEGEDAKTTIREVVWIPAGVQMTISPTSAISAQQLSVGDSLYFALIESVDIPQINLSLPRGTRFHGRVTAVSMDKLHAGIALDKAHLPSGESNHVSATFNLLFQGTKDEEGYKVPGENIRIETLAPDIP